MGCKNRSTQSPNSKHFHFEPSFYKLAACHVKTVNLRRAVGCEPCLFVSHFLLFVNYSTPRLLNGPFYSAFLKVSNNIYCFARTYVRFANCYFLLSKLIVGICCGTLYFQMIFVKHRRHNPLSTIWVFSQPHHSQKTFQLKERNSFLLVSTGRGKTQLKLLLTKKGVGHYWRRNQKLPTMGSKTVDREEEEVQMGAKKLAKLVQKTGDRWAGRDQKSASREEVNSAWMGLLIEATICVSFTDLCGSIHFAKKGLSALLLESWIKTRFDMPQLQKGTLNHQIMLKMKLT